MDLTQRTCCSPTPPAWRWRSPGSLSATQSPLWIWSGATAGALAVSSCSAIRNPVAFSWKAAGLRDPQRIHRLLLVVAITVLAGSLQGYALSLAGLRRQVDPNWKRGISFLRLGLSALQMLASDVTSRMMVWLPIPLRELEPCIPSRRAQQTQAQAWFSRIELPPRSRSTHRHKPRLAVA
jgi:hypothetical protein